MKGARAPSAARTRTLPRAGGPRHLRPASRASCAPRPPQADTQLQTLIERAGGDGQWLCSVSISTAMARSYATARDARPRGLAPSLPRCPGRVARSRGWSSSRCSVGPRPRTEVSERLGLARARATGGQAGCPRAARSCVCSQRRKAPLPSPQAVRRAVTVHMNVVFEKNLDARRSVTRRRGESPRHALSITRSKSDAHVAAQPLPVAVRWPAQIADPPKSGVARPSSSARSTRPIRNTTHSGVWPPLWNAVLFANEELLVRV